MPERSLILLKPDCLERGLVGQVTERLEVIVRIVARRQLAACEDLIFRHYHDLFDRFGERARQQLREIYLGKEVIVLLVEGPDAIAQVRGLIGNGDPAKAAPDTIRGSLGIDSFERADREGRLVNNLIHASESADDAAREIAIWFGPDAASSG